MVEFENLKSIIGKSMRIIANSDESKSKFSLSIVLIKKAKAFTIKKKIFFQWNYQTVWA